MARYIVKRVLLAVLTLFLICFITFFAMNAIPGGPFNGEKAKSPAVMAVLNERYGLDQPVIVQFGNYMVFRHMIIIDEIKGNRSYRIERGEPYAEITRRDYDHRRMFAHGHLCQQKAL